MKPKSKHLVTISEWNSKSKEFEDCVEFLVYTNRLATDISKAMTHLPNKKYSVTVRHLEGPLAKIANSWAP